MRQLSQMGPYASWDTIELLAAILLATTLLELLLMLPSATSLQHFGTPVCNGLLSVVKHFMRMVLPSVPPSISRTDELF